MEASTEVSTGITTENSTELITESNFPHGAIQPAVRNHGASWRHTRSCTEAVTLDLIQITTEPHGGIHGGVRRGASIVTNL